MLPLQGLLGAVPDSVPPALEGWLGTASLEGLLGAASLEGLIGSLVADGARQGDLYGSQDGYGHEHSQCPDGVPVELALLSLLAAFGVAFGILYRALTVTTGKRKKREVGSYLVFDTQIADLFWSGNC